MARLTKSGDAPAEATDREVRKFAAEPQLGVELRLRRLEALGLRSSHPSALSATVDGVPACPKCRGEHSPRGEVSASTAGRQAVPRNLGLLGMREGKPPTDSLSARIGCRLMGVKAPPSMTGEPGGKLTRKKSGN